MTVFVDTSAIFALVDANDESHAIATGRLLHLISEQATMAVSNYVIVETCALLQRRIGLKAVRTFREDVLPLLDVKWVTERQHEIGLASLVRADRRKLSLVDCVSFEVMRDSGLRNAFAFDRHFVEEGFDCDIPAARSN
jgi:predicted nucleic acid-binding protein